MQIKFLSFHIEKLYNFTHNIFENVITKLTRNNREMIIKPTQLIKLIFPGLHFEISQIPRKLVVFSTFPNKTESLSDKFFLQMVLWNTTRDEIRTDKISLL